MQVDRTTKDRVRSIVGVAASSGELQRLDAVAASAADVKSVIVSDTSFYFTDGEFAYVGRDFESYARFSANGVTFVRRDIATEPVSLLKPHALATAAAQFEVVGAGQFDGSYDCYLLPVPRGLSPIVIASRIPDVYLVAGIDFTCHDGYIALRDNPAEVLAPGVVRVVTAELHLSSPNSYVVASPEIRRGNRRIADYFRKSQSIRSFRLAAAQYCGLYVFDEDDRVLYAYADGVTATYIMANAGVIRLAYTHRRLNIGQFVPAGFVVGLRFDFLEFREHGYGMLQAAKNSGARVSLDFVSSVAGIAWIPERAVTVNYVETTAGKPHARLILNGSEQALREFWDAQKRHELATGLYLADALGITSDTPIVVDMDTLLENFYGERLTLAVCDQLPTEMQKRLKEFLHEHRPTGCALLYAMVPGSLLVDNTEFYFSYGNLPMVHGSDALVYTSSNFAINTPTEALTGNFYTNSVGDIYVDSFSNPYTTA
jgi:hypothetical protein